MQELVQTIKVSKRLPDLCCTKLLAKFYPCITLKSSQSNSTRKPNMKSHVFPSNHFINKFHKPLTINKISIKCYARNQWKQKTKGTRNLRPRTIFFKFVKSSGHKCTKHKDISVLCHIEEKLKNHSHYQMGFPKWILLSIWY